MSSCGCGPEPVKVKYLVQERDSAYRFVVVEDLGRDHQQFGDGHWYKDIAHFTFKPWAEDVAKQLNQYGVLYFPGMRMQDNQEWIR